MLEIRELVEGGVPSEVLELPFEQRQKSRLRADLASGRSVGIFLPPGTVLRDGALLRATDGRVIAVRAADEDVSTARAADPLLLVRVAYHLGNRHVHLQVGPGFVRYQHDRVLDDMVRRLGAEVTPESAPFEPEAGAYAPGDEGQHHG